MLMLVFMSLRVVKTSLNSGFHNRKVGTSIATPPGWDACPSQVSSKHFCQAALTDKAINANPRLQVNRGFEFSCIKVFFTVNVLYSF